MAIPIPIAAAGVSSIANIAGAAADMYVARRNQIQNERLQKEFAQNGIRWKVEDAKAAGVHPLYAIGASGSSYSPVSVGSNIGAAMAQSGQDISRAMNATRPLDEREKWIQDMQDNMLYLDMQRRELENLLIQRQINQSFNQVGPALPTPPEGVVKNVPDERISNDPRDTSKTAGDRHPMWKSYEFIPGLRVDLPYSNEGPAESMEGVGPVVATLLRNLAGRPAIWGDRVIKKGLRRYRQEVITSPYHYKKRDNLVSNPSYGR